MRHALLGLGVAGPLLLAAALWAAPVALRGRDPVLACQIAALRNGPWGSGDPWGGPWITMTTMSRSLPVVRSVRVVHSPGPNGTFEPDDAPTSDDVTLDTAPRQYPLAAHLLSLPPAGVAALALVVAAFALGRWLRRAPARTRARELGRSLLHAAPAWAVGLGWAAWFVREREASGRPWWTLVEASPLLVSAAWSPLVVWLVGSFVACHLWGRPASQEAQTPAQTPPDPSG